MGAKGNSKNLRTAIYVRVSTTEQNPESQLQELRQVAQARGLAVVSEFVDHGFSGVTKTRPGLDDLLASAEAGKLDLVLVWKIDRVGRSLSHLLQVIEQLTDLGVGFESLHDPGISTTSATGSLMLAIVGAFAAYERAILVERVRSGMARAKAEGRHVGRPRVELDLRPAVALLAEGRSLREVAVILGVSRATLRRRLREQDLWVSGSGVVHKGTDEQTQEARAFVVQKAT